MKRHHTGSGRRQVIATDWEIPHRVVANGTHRGRVDLRIPGTRKVWSPAKDRNDNVPNEPYATNVPARVLELNGEAKTIRLGDDNEIVVDFMVAIAADGHPVEAGHLVRVHTTTDALLNGTQLQVKHVGRGTERFERHLFCIHVA